MAQVSIEQVIEHLRSEVRQALGVAMKDSYPHVAIDDYRLYRAFRRAIRCTCDAWMEVPDDLVRGKVGSARH